MPHGHNGSRKGCCLSAEIHVTEINGDHQHFQDRSTVRTSGIGASTRWEPYPVRFAVLRCQLRTHKATGHSMVVMPAKHQVVTEKRS